MKPLKKRTSNPVKKTSRKSHLKPVRRTSKPVKKVSFAPVDLVAVRSIEPGLRLDVRYATSNNFVGRPVYPVATVYLQRPVALALARAHARLARTPASHLRDMVSSCSMATDRGP